LVETFDSIVSPALSTDPSSATARLAPDPPSFTVPSSSIVAP